MTNNVLEDDEIKNYPPVHINTFSLPHDSKVKLAYAVYNPSPECLNLKSERNRTIFPEVFITNEKLRNLGDLSVRTLATEYGRKYLMPNDSLRYRLQLDSINIDLPLEEIYQIEDVKFWRRVVLSKTKNSGLNFKDDNFDWRGEGISLKYVELVEACPAEYWPEQKMRDLALKVKDFVTHLHIRSLQSMVEYSFKRYLERALEIDTTTSTNISVASSEEKSGSEVGESEGEDKDDGEAGRDSRKSILYNKHYSHGSETIDRPIFRFSSFVIGAGPGDIEDEKTMTLNERLRMKKKARKEVNRKEKGERRIRRETQYLSPELEQQLPLKPKKIRVRDFYSLPVEEPIDDEDKKVDHRNLKKYLAYKKNYHYPPEHCHHIDLRFVRFFDKLVSFEIEFNPPELNGNYHTRHFNFSYDDIEHLASGISDLHTLRIFRLRNSRMDEEKLLTLTAALIQLEVEVLDFGYDNLKDDCGIALYELFANSMTIKSLELEGNYLGVHSMQRLGSALRIYKGYLKYLGLARNPITDDALHALCGNIASIKQIESLSLAGIHLSTVAMICCISFELLIQHKVLRELDLTASPFGPKAANELVVAMHSNHKIIRLDCRGCNLDERNEFDIEVSIQRNQYLTDHPYREMPPSEIQSYLRRIKNPILLKGKERFAEKQACLAARPDIAEPYSPKSLLQLAESRTSVLSMEPERFTEFPDSSMSHSSEDTYNRSKVPFVYKPNEFNFEQFYEHVEVPGPSQRYQYFQTRNRVHCENID